LLRSGVDDVQSAAAPVAPVAVRAGYDQTFSSGYVGNLSVIINALLNKRLVGFLALSDFYAFVLHLPIIAQKVLAVNCRYDTAGMVLVYKSPQCVAN
jgi:hypothetical protein